MSVKNLETAVLAELRRQPGCALLKIKDVQQWDHDLANIEVKDRETLVHLPENNVYVVYLEGASNPRGMSRRGGMRR